MAKIEITESLRSKLGADMAMDVHLVDVKLKDGSIFKNLVVRGRRYITGQKDDKNGIGGLDFSSDDILKIRRTSIFPFF